MTIIEQTLMERMNNSGLKIQKFSADDIGALQPLVDLFVQSHPSLPFIDNYWNAFRNWLSDGLNNVNFLCLLAKLEERIVGFIAGDIRKNLPLFAPEQIGHVSVLVVHHEHRTKGIGEALWDEMRNCFISKGIDHFELYTEHENKISGPFWGKRGFEVYLEKRRRYPK
jgi:ribosomal protein S18 acetylase RimI-like enzyme